MGERLLQQHCQRLVQEGPQEREDRLPSCQRRRVRKLMMMIWDRLTLKMTVMIKMRLQMRTGLLLLMKTHDGNFFFVAATDSSSSAECSVARSLYSGRTAVGTIIRRI